MIIYNTTKGLTNECHKIIYIQIKYTFYLISVPNIKQNRKQIISHLYGNDYVLISTNGRILVPIIIKKI